jgi:DNA-directed RNA polymerase specialized sigma24 family protein
MPEGLPPSGCNEGSIHARPFPRNFWLSARITSVDASDQTPVDYEALLRIAEAAAYEIVSPSARSNLIDQIAADALEQYVEEVNSGTEIQNPHGWVATTARRRALDTIKKWERIKKATRRLDAEPEIDDYYMNEISLRLDQALDKHVTDPASIVVEREWITELIEITYPDDAVNRDIAVACLVEGSRPRDIADDFGMSAKVIGNRLVRIRERLRDTLPAADPDWRYR